MKEIGQRAARDRDPEPAHLLGLPIERNGVGALGGDDESAEAVAVARALDARGCCLAADGYKGLVRGSPSGSVRERGGDVQVPQSLRTPRSHQSPSRTLPLKTICPTEHAFFVFARTTT